MREGRETFGAETRGVGRGQTMKTIGIPELVRKEKKGIYEGAFLPPPLGFSIIVKSTAQTLREIIKMLINYLLSEQMNK